MFQEEDESYQEVVILLNKIMNKPCILEQHPCFLEFMRNYLDKKSKIIEVDDECLPPEFDETESPKTRGKKAMVNGEFSDAIVHFSECLKQPEWKSSPLVISQRAEAYYENGNIDKALIDANYALSCNSNSAKALVVKAKCHNIKKEFKEAFESISKAQSIDYNPELKHLETEMKTKLSDSKNTPDCSSSRSSSSSIPNMMDMLNNPDMIAMAQNMIQQNPDMIQNYMKSLESDSNMQSVIQSMMNTKK